MTFEDKLILVLVSVLLSTLVNLLMNRLNIYVNECITILRTKKKLPLFAQGLIDAITNESPELVEKDREGFLLDYGIICKNKKIEQDFLNLNSYYIFLLSQGYKANQSRKENDIAEIEKISQKYVT